MDVSFPIAAVAGNEHSVGVGTMAGHVNIPSSNFLLCCWNEAVAPRHTAENPSLAFFDDITHPDAKRDIL